MILSLTRSRDAVGVQSDIPVSILEITAKGYPQGGHYESMPGAGGGLHDCLRNAWVAIAA